ncbi:MAG: class I SAM-dependent methyltransferase, partial [Clostridia bacterium]|nr:class I SAM-dependent methyltransferase [Clostridia bacterium]
GNGNDTLKLCKKVGKTGKVFAFDIQDKAIEETKKLVFENGFTNAQIIKDSHEFMDKYVHEKVRAVIFNLGYLPGGDHKLQTKGETTIEAIKKALDLICDDGFIAIMIYHGKNSGTEEKLMLTDFLKTIDHKKYTVTLHDFFNRPNNPPITAVITKAG